MDGNTTTYLPHEIIESILFRLPVKSLLRFKSVCRQWNVIISDPKFAQTHLRISKKLSSLSCIRQNHRLSTPPSAQLVSFENDEFKHLPDVCHPPLKTHNYRFLCHCDGLYVISYSVGGDDDEYALWNPSRRSCKKLNQYKFHHYTRISGICYDPLLDDYKVVIGDAKHYAVFYCRKNQWSNLKEMNPILGIRYCHGSGAPMKGSIYWVCCAREYGSEYEIVYFDGRDEKWMNLGKVGLDESAQHESAELELISSGEGLYLFQYDLFPSKGMPIEPLFMKKVGEGEGEGEWMELEAKGMPDYGGGDFFPRLCGHETKLLLRYPYGDYVVIYDVSKRSLARVECFWNSILTYTNLFPYHENMFWD